MFSRKSAISKRTNSWLCCIYSYLWRPPVTRALCGLLSTEFSTSICSPTNTEYRNTKLQMHKYKMTETKSYTISVTGALWQLLPTEFPSSICFPTNSTPLPKHNNNILHNHKGIYQSHFHFAIGILYDNVTMSMSLKEQKGGQSQSQVLYCSTLWYQPPIELLLKKHPVLHPIHRLVLLTRLWYENLLRLSEKGSGCTQRFCEEVGEGWRRASEHGGAR